MGQILIQHMGSPRIWWEDRVSPRPIDAGGAGELRALAIRGHSMHVSVGAVETLHSLIGNTVTKKRCRESFNDVRRQVKYAANARFLKRWRLAQEEHFEWSSDSSLSSLEPKDYAADNES